VQCAANLSEGRDAAKLQAFAAASGSVPGCRLIDWSADPDHHRSVFTLFGTPDAVEMAAFELTRIAVEQVDLRVHSGVHPRCGAMDVLPFTPWGGATMDDCIRLAHGLGARIGEELGVPVYFYEEASSGRRLLRDLRRGGFEGLPVRLEGDRRPDCGPDRPHPTAGVTAVGARGPLVAFNVWFEATARDAVREIARRIRESDGGLPGIRALGLYLPGRDQCQVSVNITRPEVTGVTEVYGAIATAAAELGFQPLRSEVIGALPLPTLLQAAADRWQASGLGPHRVLDLWEARMGGAE
jgi:glutamate formiminotransferase